LGLRLLPEGELLRLINARTGQAVLTQLAKAELEKRRAVEERQLAKTERRRAQEEQQRAEKLAAEVERLRQLLNEQRARNGR
jgi:hypothetical protein